LGFRARQDRVVIGDYQQPVSDAIGILATLGLACGGSVALILDLGHWRSRLAEQVAARNQRSVLRRLPLLRSAYWDTDAESISRSYKVMAIGTLAIFGLVLAFDLVVLVANGVR